MGPLTEIYILAKSEGRLPYEEGLPDGLEVLDLSHIPAWRAGPEVGYVAERRHSGIYKIPALAELKRNEKATKSELRKISKKFFIEVLDWSQQKESISAIKNGSVTQAAKINIF